MKKLIVIHLVAWSGNMMADWIMYYEAPRIGFQNWYKIDFQKNGEIVRVREKSRYTKIPTSPDIRSVII